RTTGVVDPRQVALTSRVVRRVLVGDRVTHGVGEAGLLPRNCMEFAVPGSCRDDSVDTAEISDGAVLAMDRKPQRLDGNAEHVHAFNGSDSNETLVVDFCFVEGIELSMGCSTYVQQTLPVQAEFARIRAEEVRIIELAAWSTGRDCRNAAERHTRPEIAIGGTARIAQCEIRLKSALAG